MMTKTLSRRVMGASMGVKLALCALLFTVPLVTVTALLAMQLREQITFVDKEIAGAAYLPAVWAVTEAAANGGDVEGAKAKLRQVRAEADARFGSGAAVDALMAAKPGSATLAGKAAITAGTVQQFVDARSREEWNGHPVKPKTVRKAVATLRFVWNWANRQGLVV